MEDSERNEYLETLFAEGIELADYNVKIWRVAALKCLELSQDKEAQDAFTFCLPLPRGVKGRALGKAAELFPAWFEEDAVATGFDLFTLFEFSRLSETKAKALYQAWEAEGRSWPLDEVIDRVEARGARKTMSSGLNFEGDVNFRNDEKRVIIKPIKLAMLGLSNGSYKVKLKRIKEPEK